MEPRVTDELAQQLVLGEADVLQGVCREEAVLCHEERGLRRLGDAPGNRRQIGRLLRVARQEHAPARVRDRHQVVMAGMDVERLTGQRPGSHVEDHRQAFAGDDVQDLLHEDEALARGEVGYPRSGEGCPFGCRRRRMLRLGFDESERRAPQVGLPFGNRRLEDGGHRRGWRDGIHARDLGEAGLDMRDRLRSVNDRAQPRVAGRHRFGLHDASVRLRQGKAAG